MAVTERQARQALFDLHKEAHMSCPSCGAKCCSGIWTGCDYGDFDSECEPEAFEKTRTPGVNSKTPGVGSGCGAWQRWAVDVLLGKHHLKAHIQHNQWDAVCTLYSAGREYGAIKTSTWTLEMKWFGSQSEEEWTKMWATLICG